MRPGCLSRVNDVLTRFCSVLNAERRLLVLNGPASTGYLQRETARRRGTRLIVAQKSHDFLVGFRHMKTRSENECLSPAGYPATPPERPCC